MAECEHGFDTMTCVRCSQTVGQQHVWTLTLPFVVARSNGGYYDDDALVAGWQLGYLDAEMRHSFADQIKAYVYPGTLPQLDLSAMRHGWTMKAQPWEEHPEEWALVILTRSCDPAGSSVPPPDH